VAALFRLTLDVAQRHKTEDCDNTVTYLYVRVERCVSTKGSYDCWRLRKFQKSE